MFFFFILYSFSSSFFVFHSSFFVSFCYVNYNSLSDFVPDRNFYDRFEISNLLSYLGYWTTRVELEMKLSHPSARSTIAIKQKPNKTSL